MASTILYKFRSGTNFEPLPLPGTSARLFDIKRAIVRAKKLDSSSSNTSLEFDLAIQNAATNEVYDDEGMILPRGTRIVVRRVAAERGRGILSRMAQGGAGPMGGAPSTLGGNAARDGFYTIRSRDRDADDEFLDANPPQAAPGGPVDESKELEALKLVTDQAGSMYGSNMGGGGHMGGRPPPRDPRVAGQGAPPPHFAKPPPMNPGMNKYRPNADPELRQQEVMPKKRATGIPRTFLNLSAPAPAPTEGDNLEGDGEGGEQGNLASQLQPSAQAFQALVKTGGGQSLADASKRRDLDYALKLTATSIPDHLQCGICHSIVKNAMLVPWDTEGRPTCESCIRDGLTKNGFTCPLTGTEGVSPDDLFPNVGLRKAAEAFVKDVMDKMDSIERQIEAEEEEEAKKRAEEQKRNADAFDDTGDGIVTKKSKLNNKKKGGDDDLLFGGDDEFGGDVFDVAGDEPEEEDEDELIEPKKVDTNNVKAKDGDTTKNGEDGDNTDANKASDGKDNDQHSTNESNSHSNKSDDADAQKLKKEDSQGSGEGASSPSKTGDGASTSSASATKPARKEAPKRSRGPPAGYVLGPAGSGGARPAGGIASPPNVGMMNLQHPPPPQMMGGPPGPPPGAGPPGRGGPPFGDMGRGGGGRGPPGRGFYPDQGYGGRGGGGRFPPGQQQFPPHGGGGRGGPPMGGFQQGGRGGFQGRGGQQWDNRKRPHDAMMEQHGSPAPNNMHQGGGGRGPGGYQQGRGFQGRGGYNPQFDGRGGGRFGGGGRGFRGRGGWGGRGRY